MRNFISGESMTHQEAIDFLRLERAKASSDVLPKYLMGEGVKPERIQEWRETNAMRREAYGLAIDALKVVQALKNTGITID